MHPPSGDEPTIAIPRSAITPTTTPPRPRRRFSLAIVVVLAGGYLAWSLADCVFRLPHLSPHLSMFVVGALVVGGLRGTRRRDDRAANELRWLSESARARLAAVERDVAFVVKAVARVPVRATAPVPGHGLDPETVASVYALQRRLGG